MNKAIVTLAIVLTVVLGVLLVSSQLAKAPAFGSTTNIPKTASTTVFTLTTTSQRLLATSTKRSDFTIDNINCSLAGTVFLKFNKDVVATANTGPAVFASSTKEFGENFLPDYENSVQGIVNVGTCTVIVTEWRTNF